MSYALYAGFVGDAAIKEKLQEVGDDKERKKLIQMTKKASRYTHEEKKEFKFLLLDPGWFL